MSPLDECSCPLRFLCVPCCICSLASHHLLLLRFVTVCFCCVLLFLQLPIESGICSHGRCSSAARQSNHQLTTECVLALVMFTTVFIRSTRMCRSDGSGRARPAHARQCQHRRHGGELMCLVLDMLVFRGFPRLRLLAMLWLLLFCVPWCVP